MDEMYVAEPADFTGVFSWNRKTLESTTKATLPVYDKHDPRTWPRFDSHHVVDAGDVKPALPSLWVAYSKPLMQTILGMKFRTSLLSFPSAAHMAVDHGTIFNWRFYYYPFNFTRRGELRVSVGIPKEDFEYWMDCMNGPEWKAKFPGTMAKFPNGASAKISASTTPFDLIMSTLAAENTTSLTIHNLQDDLAASETRYQHEKQRADTAEALNKQHAASIARAKLQASILTEQLAKDATKHNTDTENLRSALSVQKAQAASEKIEVERLEAELASAKQETKEANKRIEIIWAEMQKGKGKRKAGDEIAGGDTGGKRARCESEETLRE
jgi:hypothetical protein